MTTIHPSDLARFFDQAEPLPLYRSAMEEIAALQRGEKPISAFSFPRAAIEGGAADYADLAQAVLDSGMALTLRRDRSSVPQHEQVYVFAHREGEAWRVAAWLAMREILGRYAWSDALEALESAILGYTEEQTVQWTAYQRARRLGWVGRTVYILMTSDQCQRIVNHGSRSFPNEMSSSETLTWFASRSSRPIASDAATKCPPGHSLARVAISRDAFKSLFGHRLQSLESDVVNVDVPASGAASLNECLESNIEFLGKRKTGAIQIPEIPEIPDQGS